MFKIIGAVQYSIVLDTKKKSISFYVRIRAAFFFFFKLLRFIFLLISVNGDSDVILKVTKLLLSSGTVASTFKNCLPLFLDLCTSILSYQ